MATTFRFVGVSNEQMPMITRGSTETFSIMEDSTEVVQRVTVESTRSLIMVPWYTVKLTWYQWLNTADLLGKMAFGDGR